MMRYRRRPPWWPENEPFPPTRRWGRGYGPPPFVRWIGCFVLTLFGVSLLAGGLAGAIFGRGGGFGVHPFFLIPIFVVIALVALGVFGGVRRMAQPMNNLIEAAGSSRAIIRHRFPSTARPTSGRWRGRSTRCPPA